MHIHLVCFFQARFAVSKTFKQLQYLINLNKRNELKHVESEFKFWLSSSKRL